MAGRPPVSEVIMIFCLVVDDELHRCTPVEVFVFSPDFLLSHSLAECVSSASEPSLGAHERERKCDSHQASAFASVYKSRKLLYPADVDRYGGCG